MINEELLTDEEFQELCEQFGIQNSPSVLVVSRVGRPRRYENNSVLSLRLPSEVITKFRRYCKQNDIVCSDLFIEFVNSL